MLISDPPTTTATLRRGWRGESRDLVDGAGIRFQSILDCFEVDTQGPQRG